MSDIWDWADDVAEELEANMGSYIDDRISLIDIAAALREAKQSGIAEVEAELMAIISSLANSLIIIADSDVDYFQSTSDQLKHVKKVARHALTDNVYESLKVRGKS